MPNTPKSLKEVLQECWPSILRAILIIGVAVYGYSRKPLALFIVLGALEALLCLTKIISVALGKDPGRRR